MDSDRELQYCNVQAAKTIYYVADGLSHWLLFLCTSYALFDDDDVNMNDMVLILLPLVF